MPHLLNLPWELLYDRKKQSFLALSNKTPIIRYLDINTLQKPTHISDKLLRVLVVVTNISSGETLNVEKEWENIIDSLKSELKNKQVVIDRLSKSTLDCFQQQLRKYPYHVVHFIGHGVFDERTGDGKIILEDENGRAVFIDATRLGVILNDKDTIRLVILNACETGKTSLENSFSGVAQKLLEQGIPAVIAMQEKISDHAAIRFSKEFFSSLVDGYSIEFALTEGRKAIYTDEPSKFEWAIPALYMQSENGHLFDFKRINFLKKIKKNLALIFLSLLLILVINFGVGQNRVKRLG